MSKTARRDVAAPCNEVGRVLVALPADATCYGGPKLLAVAFDRGDDDSVTAVLLHPPRTELPYLSRYEVFSVLCADRAQRTVDRTLVVDARPITPERYLALWRRAARIDLAAFAAIHRYVLVARIAGPLRSMRGVRAPWDTSPFDRFEDFEALYRDRMQVGPDEEDFVLEIPFSAVNGARDAFYAESFLLSQTRYLAGPAPVTVELRSTSGYGTPGGQQTELPFPCRGCLA
jgi:hypothetical protein